MCSSLTKYRDLDEVGGPLAVKYDSVHNSCAELKVYVTAVSHVKRGQIDGSVSDAERHYIVEQV